MEEIETHLIKDLKNINGTSESLRMYAITTIHSGETELVINFTLSKRMPVQDLAKATKICKKLTAGNGRRMYDLEEIANQELFTKEEINNIK